MVRLWLYADVLTVGIVFAPTLNVPGPLISSFVEDSAAIFGEPVDEATSPISSVQSAPQTASSTDLRSPRKQMFTDLPTPAYNQTHFQPLGGSHGGSPATNDTGMIPMHPTYQMAPQGDGGYGSLNDALRSPQMSTFGGSQNSSPGGLSVPKDVKSKRRESSMMVMNTPGNNVKKAHLSGVHLTGVGEEDAGRF